MTLAMSGAREAFSGFASDLTPYHDSTHPPPPPPIRTGMLPPWGPPVDDLGWGGAGVDQEVPSPPPPPVSVASGRETAETMLQQPLQPATADVLPPPWHPAIAPATADAPLQQPLQPATADAQLPPAALATAPATVNNLPQQPLQPATAPATADAQLPPAAPATAPATADAPLQQPLQPATAPATADAQLPLEAPVVRRAGGLKVAIEEGKEEEADTLASTPAGVGAIWVAEGGVGGVNGEDEAAPPAPLVCLCV